MCFYFLKQNVVAQDDNLFIPL